MKYLKIFETFKSPIIAYRGQRIDHNPPNGGSGYFNGTYFFVGKDAEQKAKEFQSGIIIKADITNAKLYQLYGNSNNTHDFLKKEARKAGYYTSQASGNGECEYLKSLGYDGIHIGNEVILFDKNNFLVRETLQEMLISEGYDTDFFMDGTLQQILQNLLDN